MATQVNARPLGPVQWNNKLVANIICRAVISVVFGISAFDKIVHPFDFTNVLSFYTFLPTQLDGLLLSLIVGLEILLGLFMLIGLFGKRSALSAAILLGVYTIFLLDSLATGNTNHGCGCFTTAGAGQSGLSRILAGGDHISISDVIRDLLFVGVAVLAVLTYEPKFGLDWMRRPVTNSYDLSNWENLRLRSRFSLTVVGVTLLGAGLGCIGQVSLAHSETAPLVNEHDFHPTGHPLAVNTVAPNFSLSTSVGQSVSLNQYRGHVVLLEFFALWCPHCQANAPIIHQLNAQLPSSEFQTISVIASPYSKNYDTSGGTDATPYSRLDIRWFTNKYHVTNPILIDPNFQVSNTYLSQWYPTLYVVDKKGIIRDVFSSTTPKSTLLRAIHQLE